MQINKEVKNSVFLDLFEQKGYQLKLFQALHPEMADVGEGDLKAVTIKQVILNHQYNDLALLVKDRVMVFVEAQSTWSRNILIRLLMYFTDTVHEYIHDNKLSLHQSKVIPIPTPEFYVIYTGRTSVPSKISLRRDFFGDESCPIDLEAEVLFTETEDIVGQYITFSRVIDDQVKVYGRTEKAAWAAIRICSDRGILNEYLAGREKEVVSIMTQLFDQEYATEQFGNAREAEGREKGREEGRKEGREETRVEAVKGMYEAGATLDMIARGMKTTVDAVKKMLGIGQEPTAFG